VYTNQLKQKCKDLGEGTRREMGKEKKNVKRIGATFS